eukprot:3098880-Rhodomonas_salina.4
MAAQARRPRHASPALYPTSTSSIPGIALCDIMLSGALDDATWRAATALYARTLCRSTSRGSATPRFRAARRARAGHDSARGKLLLYSYAIFISDVPCGATRLEGYDNAIESQSDAFVAAMNEDGRWQWATTVNAAAHTTAE